MNKRISAIFLSSILILAMSATAFAHSGRTDSRGGHRDRRNVSGLGSYHFHCGGYPPHLHSGGVCPYTSTGRTTASSSSTSKSKTKSTSAKTVTTYVKKVIPVQKVTIKEKYSSLLVGEYKYLSSSLYPENSTSKSITWSSSNGAVASVSSVGKLTANSAGTATITASHGNIKDSFIIKVISIEPKHIEIIYPESAEKQQLRINNQLNLSAKITPANSTDKTVYWSIDNENIAKIDSNGTLTATGTGIVTVTARTSNGIAATSVIKLYALSTEEKFFIFGIIAFIFAAIYFIKKRTSNNSNE